VIENNHITKTGEGVVARILTLPFLETGNWKLETEGFASAFSGNRKPETGNSLVSIYPKTWDIGRQRS
jgi:hypothetical protein